MDQSRSTAIGALVLIGGGAAAMMFRKPVEPNPPQEKFEGRGFAIAVADNEQNGGVVLRDDAERGKPYAPLDAAATQSRLAEIRDAEANRRDQSVARPVETNAPPPIPRTPPPSIPSTYGDLLNSSGGERVLSSPREMMPRRRSQRRREHKTRDYDTLESIAERYYGDEQLASALFEANRDRLPSRSLLPLGVVLRLPGEEELRNLTSSREAASPTTQPESPQARTTLGSVR